MGKANNSTIIPPFPLSDNNYAFTDKEKAECLNNIHFSICTIDESVNYLPNYESKTNSVLSNTNIAQKDVNDILTSLKFTYS